MNYQELCTALQDTLENTFTATDMARFVGLVEQRVYQRVQPPALRKNQTGSLSANNPYLSLPGGFLFVYSLAVQLPTGRYENLLNKDVNYVREVYPFPGTVGVPKTYAIFDENTLILGPTPSTNYVVELHYAAYPPSIAVAGTSWLGDTFDSVLFNGMVVEGARHMKAEADLMAVYEKAFITSLEELKQMADGKLRQDAYRSGQVRNPVN